MYIFRNLDPMGQPDSMKYLNDGRFHRKWLWKHNLRFTDYENTRRPAVSAAEQHASRTRERRT
jgi:hypothetical protein